MKASVVIKIGGMSCVRCSAAVENALLAVSGVASVSVSYANGRAEIEYDDSLTNRKTLEKAIKNAGYDVITDVRTARKREYIITLYTLCFSFVLALPFFVMMGDMVLFPEHHALKFLHNGYLQLALATPIQLVAGYRFYKGAYHSLKNKSPGMDLLVTLGTTISYVYSVYALLADKEMLYFESSAMIITLVLLGKTLESRAKSRMGEAIEKLIDLSPKTACVMKDGVLTEISASKISVGDTVLVRAGEAIAADGVIVDGECYIDESMLTGESMPVGKKIGDKVYGGTINGNNAFSFRAEGVGSDTVLSGIIRLVEEAQASKAHIQNIADKVSAVFVPAVAVISALTAVITQIATGDINLSIERAVAVLVIACPCSLGLATPTALIVGIGKGAENGILIKNADALERASEIGAVVFDKTGTVTVGKPAVTEIIPIQNGVGDALVYAASAEATSGHPLAAAIVNKYSGELLECTDSVTELGNGIRAVVNRKNVIVGKVSWIESECGCVINEKTALPIGETHIAVAVDGLPSLLISISDRVRADSRDAVARIKSMGIKTLLVTGDNESTAKKVCDETGIEEYYANVLPEGKADIIKKLKTEYKGVAMIGDGINDAPALSVSDVGFAVGNGTDVAIESGDIVLSGKGIGSVSNALVLAKATVKKIRQNLFWAFFYNTVGIPLAAFGLLSPVIASCAMAFSSVSVVTNSLLLKRIKLKGYGK